MAFDRRFVPRQRLMLRATLLALTSVLTLGLLNLHGDGAPADRPQTVEAASGPIYWGAYVHNGVDDTSKIDDFEARAGKRISLFMFGQSWKRNGGYQSFPGMHLQRVRDRGTIPVLDWFTAELGRGVNQSDFQLRDIYNGNHDAYITTWARASKAWGKPFFMRLNAEMNGWWHPYSEQTNGNSSGDFVKAWRHIVDIFRREGANNVTWVWCPNVQGPSSTPLPGLYPGDSYVDWVCMDGYNYGTDHGNKWHPFTNIFKASVYNGYIDTYALLGQVAPNKPIMVGETASSEDGGSKANWITTLLGTELPVGFPRVKALIWFNWNADDPVKDWPIQSSPASQAAFRAGIASSYYASNQYGNISSSPIQPPGGSSAPPAPTPTPTPKPSGGGAPPPPPSGRTLHDFDNDGKADIAVFRPGNGTWYVRRSRDGNQTIGWGKNGDIPVAADFDGDGRTDIAAFRPSSGTWYNRRTSAGEQTYVWGQNGDIPAPADFDADGKADMAVFRPSNATWYIRRSKDGNQTFAWGKSGDVPVAADYDGDGKADIAVFRASNATWYIRGSSAGSTTMSWGKNGDIPVPADFDGDGRADIAVFRPSNGDWYVRGSKDGNITFAWGKSGDIPAPADYDGDGKADMATFRPSNANWYIRRSNQGNMTQAWGANGDIPAEQRPAYPR